MLMILSYMYHDDCALLIILWLFYTLCIRVVVLYVVLMDWYHVIKAQGGCIFGWCLVLVVSAAPFFDCSALFSCDWHPFN